MRKSEKSRELKESVKRYISGDSEAWNTLVKVATPLIIYVAKNKLKRLGFPYQDTDLENLKQDVFLSIWKEDKLRAIKDCDKAVSWIYTIAANAASNLVRDLKPVDLPKAAMLCNKHLARDCGPSDELSDKETSRAIEAAMATLNPKELLIIKLSLLYEKKYREIARLLNMPIGSVLVTSRRAKMKLKKILKNYVIK